MEEMAANPVNPAAPPAAGETPPAASTAPASPPVALSIGERLRAGRERSGLSIPAAAEKLHLDPKIIEALEADRFAEVGASVYVRGHLKRYADFVGEPGAELVSLYSTRESRANAPDLRQVPQAERRADPRRLVTPLIAVGGAAVLFAAVWWVLAGSRPASVPTASQPAPATRVVSPEPSPATPAASATPVALGTTSAVDAPAVTAPAAAPAPAPAATTPAPAREAPAREVSLRLELANDSWVEIYDARNERLFYDVASAGSVQSVAGRAPLRVVLGNAAGVTVAVDGQAREIPEGSSDGEGARFVVNRSGSLSRARQ